MVVLSARVHLYVRGFERRDGGPFAAWSVALRLDRLPGPVRTSYTKQSGTAVTWSGGISVLGFSATTRSGFNSKTKIAFSFSASRRLCGDTGYPPQAKRVRVKF